MIWRLNCVVMFALACSTPLNGIMGHIDLILSNGLGKEYEKDNLEGLQVAMESGKLLLSIIQGKTFPEM